MIKNKNKRYNTENATTNDIRNAAEQANALKFIQDNFGNKFSYFQCFCQKIIFISSFQFIVFYVWFFILQADSGFNKEVGSEGSLFSGGQKQRLAIARVIINKPKILLLDEATSALDRQNEEIVQESLNKVMLNKTSVIIAHRISTIKDADEILVFDSGKIIERGTYNDLLEKQGVSPNLYKPAKSYENL